MKKMIRLSALLLLAVMLLVSLTGCSIEIEDNEEIRCEVDRLLSALMTGDEGAGYDAVYSGIERESFRAAFSQMAELLEGVESYELTPIGFNCHTVNGLRTIRMTYRMHTNVSAFVVEAMVRDDCDGLISFHIAPEEQTALSHTGTLGHMEGATAGQWLVLLLGLLGWAFVIWMAVDCGRRKIRHKWLWLLLIILGGMLLTLTVRGSAVNFQFNLGLHLRLSSWIAYGDGTRQLQLLIPAGAVIYCIRRKRLTQPNAEEVSQQEVENKEEGTQQ